MTLENIMLRLDELESYIHFSTHAKINNAMGGNMHCGTFDQYCYSRHKDHLLPENAIIIPAMTNPLGKYWNQPDQRQIYIDAEKAYMREREFNALVNYTHSLPSGAYIGKIWKGQNIKGDWYLGWYGPYPTSGYCSNNYRDIAILPERNYRYELDDKRTLTILS